MAAKGLTPASDNLMLLLSLVPYVLDRHEVSVEEAAAHFQRTDTDIVRAVELIACAGVPGDSRAYSHLDLFDIDWDLFESERRITFWNTVALDQKPQFSAKEASALIAGLQYLAVHPAYAGRTDVQELTQKLRAGSASGANDRLRVVNSAAEQRLEALGQAIDSGMSVTMTYHNKRGESRERRIDPLRLESRDHLWYIRAYCHTRNALRTFRVDHMDNVVVGPIAQDRHEGAEASFAHSLFEPSANDVMVTLECASEALPLIADYLPRGFKAPAGATTVTLDVPFAHYGSLTRFVAGFPGVVKVLGPESAIAAVRKFAETALAAYQE